VSDNDPDKPRALVSMEDSKLEEYPWGRIRWSANAELGGSQSLTVGRVDINPRSENPQHYHPNCDEVVYVLSGRITHQVGDESFEMNAGDATVIPRDVPHQAVNNQDEKSELLVTYDTGRRETVFEESK
jgi:quercetin dioxygenase-like cupin family protein